MTTLFRFGFLGGSYLPDKNRAAFMDRLLPQDAVQRVLKARNLKTEIIRKTRDK